MIKELIGMGVSCMLLGGAGLAQATLIQEHWTGQAAFISNDAASWWAPDQILAVVITYDDEGMISNKWSDGANQQAEFGGGDDQPLPPRSIEPWELWLSDAEFDFDPHALAYMNSVDNTTDINWSYGVSWEDPGVQELKSFQADGAMFGVVLYEGVPLEMFMTIAPEGWELGDGYEIAVDFRNLQMTSQSVDPPPGGEPVPEPATMLLFGTGLAGLAGYRKRKAMKK